MKQQAFDVLQKINIFKRAVNLRRFLKHLGYSIYIAP
jgi:hypothetical protein